MTTNREGPVAIFGQPDASGDWIAFGPLPSKKAANEWLDEQPLAIFPQLILPLREPVDQAWCRHCGDIGPAGSDHTCPCPNRDGECPEHD